MLDGIRDGRPGDQRGFIHKKILGVVRTVAGVGGAIGIPGAGVVSRFLAPRRTVSRTQTARVTQFSEAEKQLGRELKFGDPAPRQITARGTSLPRRLSLVSGQGPCDPPLVMAPDGHCVAPGSGHYIQHFGTTVGGPAGMPVGEAVMGQYGAGLVPGSMAIDRAVCLKGMQLGNDGVCYNKSQLRNNQRMWPAGRKPLLTGGDMRAISIASRAGTRMDKATARLRKLGMMKKAPAARKAPAPTQHERLTEAHVTK